MHCFLHIIISLFSYGSHFFFVIVACPLDTSRRIYVHFPVDQLSSHIHFQQRQQFNLFAFTNIWWNVCISVYVFGCIVFFVGLEAKRWWMTAHTVYIQREREIETRTENRVFFSYFKHLCVRNVIVSQSFGYVAFFCHSCPHTSPFNFWFAIACHTAKGTY